MHLANYKLKWQKVKKKIVLRKSCYLIVEASIRISKPLEENCKKNIVLKLLCTCESKQRFSY